MSRPLSERQRALTERQFELATARVRRLEGEKRVTEGVLERARTADHRVAVALATARSEQLRWRESLERAAANAGRQAAE